MPPILFSQFSYFRPRQEPLVGTASESQGKVSLGLDKRPIDQSIHQVENAVCNHFYVLSLARKQVSLQNVAGVDPQGLFRIHFLEPIEQWKQCGLVLRFHGIPAQNRTTRNIRSTASFQYLICFYLSKFITVVKIPCRFVETTRTMITATADEQRYSNAVAICGITHLNVTVLHRLDMGFTVHYIFESALVHCIAR